MSLCEGSVDVPSFFAATRITFIIFVVFFYASSACMTSEIKCSRAFRDVSSVWQNQHRFFAALRF